MLLPLQNRGKESEGVSAQRDGAAALYDDQCRDQTHTVHR
jgi:hypothetical protein